MKAMQVINGGGKWAVDCADTLTWLRALPDRSLDLSVTSPPYMDARTYGIDAQRDCVEWVEWMLPIIGEAHRVTKGPVFVVCAGVTRDRNYWPGCEGLAWEWWKRGGDCQLYRPCIFRRVGIPGSGNSDYLRADWEYVLCFKHAGELPWSDNTAMGHPPKWAPGGEMSNRLSDGKRVNQWGPVGSANGFGKRFKRGAPAAARLNQWGHPIDSGATVQEEGGKVRSRGKRPSHRIVTKASQDGEGLNFGHDAEGQVKGGHPRDIPRKRKVITKKREGMHNQDQDYSQEAIANPGNVVQQRYTAEEVAELMGVPADVVDCIVGGGVMGDKIAHRNEAPFPEDLVRFFVRSFCPPGGIGGDFFSGSGTTAKVLVDEGRRAVACDLRESQVQLTTRRLESTTPPLFA